MAQCALCVCTMVVALGTMASSFGTPTVNNQMINQININQSAALNLLSIKMPLSLLHQFYIYSLTLVKEDSFKAREEKSREARRHQTQRNQDIRQSKTINTSITKSETIQSINFIK